MTTFAAAHVARIRPMNALSNSYYVLFARRSDAYHRHAAAREPFYRFDVFFRVLGQLVERFASADVVRPAVELLVYGLAVFEKAYIGGEVIHALAVALVVRRDFELR